MPKRYYSFTDTRFPPILEAVLESLRYHICQVLYSQEDYTISKDRFILTDMVQSTAIRESAKLFNLTNARFPFTAYSLAEVQEDSDTPNHFANTFKFFSDEFSCFFYAQPVTIDIPMISFFTTPEDYFRAQTLLTQDFANKTLLPVPITINGILTETYCLLPNMEISKGAYAFEFMEQLRAGNIYDIVHNMYVKYYDLIVSTADNRANLQVTPAPIIAPVDNIEVALRDLSLHRANMPDLINQFVLPSTPVISNTNPVNGATNVDVDSSIIINFNTAMNEQSVIDALLISPMVNADLLWNSTSTQLVIDIYTSMSTTTLYTVEISKSAKSTYNVPLASDYSFSFTTEA